MKFTWKHLYICRLRWIFPLRFYSLHYKSYIFSGTIHPIFDTLWKITLHRFGIYECWHTYEQRTLQKRMLMWKGLLVLTPQRKLSQIFMSTICPQHYVGKVIGLVTYEKVSWHNMEVHLNVYGWLPWSGGLTFSP